MHIRNYLKKLFYLLPRFLRISILGLYESYFRIISKTKLKRQEKTIDSDLPNIPITKKKKILFYHIHGMGFGGTDKQMQVLAKYLDKNKYEVFYMYSPKPRDLVQKGLILDQALPYMKQSGAHLIEFDYEELESTYPYFVKNARPSIFEVINKYGIELLVTTGSGYTEFPINLIKDIPIIMLNVFGSPSTQKNIVYQVCMSHAVSEKLKPIVEADIIKVMYIPQEFPPQDAIEKGEEFRASLGILPTDMVFGRIGRPTDEIFDPIGIRAFQAVVKKNPDAHYIIMAPAKSLLKILSEESIPNVHIVPTASMDPWVFHNSIDALAHFRRDGESFGLNIAESMFCSKPIISHESSIWNAHLEYLDNSFSRVAEVDNVSQYATYMQEFIELEI
jgi:glycosyltransferase involved in cell wall biosynthesis